MRFTGFDQRRVLTLAGTLVLAGAVVAAGIYGPSAWKVLRHQGAPPEQVVIQNPPVDGSNAANIPGNNPANNPAGNNAAGNNAAGTNTQAKTNPAATTQIPGLNTPPQGDTSGSKKYKEPDTKSIDLAPSIASFFSADTGLSEAAKTLAFGAAWNIHQYVDGYLYGPSAGPQMNEQDIKKYINFHKTMWDKQLKNEANANKTTVFNNYLDVMLNRGMDAFDSKDKARIEQFHQEIHDLDAHLFRNDASAKIYGATPFPTKR